MLEEIGKGGNTLRWRVSVFTKKNIRQEDKVNSLQNNNLKFDKINKYTGIISGCVS